MTSEHRPSLDRTPTRSSEKKRREEFGVGVEIRVDGKEYRVTQGDLSALDTMELRRATGLSFIGLLEAMGDSPDLDLVASVIWLSRRVKGEHGLSYADVAGELGYDAEIGSVERAEPGPEPDPEGMDLGEG